MSDESVKMGKPIGIIKHGDDGAILDLWQSEDYITIRKMKSDLSGMAKVVHIRMTLLEAHTLYDLLGGLMIKPN